MELAKLFIKILVDNNEAIATIDETTKNAEKSGSKLGNLAQNVGNAAIKMGKVAAKATAAAVGAAATGISAITKQAVSSYAEYEQLVGGVETLFKDSANKVMEYANKAYETAGLSANEYMETVTSFSASLLQSLGGDTEKAAEYADRAIVDMSDNANKMGTSMESIQNAYNGFAKQNYTMLDNLKLGYGGTKEEMARLIQEASEMKDIQEELGVTVDANSMSFGNIVNAISVVQKKLDIAGTTAKEASTTIQGSLGAMKSAWKNLVTGMADPNQDIGVLIGNMVDTALTFINNIAPRIVETLPRVVEGISKLIQNLSPYIPPILEQLIPVLIKGATQIVAVLVKDLPNILKTLGVALYDSLKLIFKEISGSDTFAPLIDGFKNAMNFIQEIFSDEIEGIKDTWENHLKPVFDAIVSFVNDVLLPVFEYVFKTGIVPLVKTAFDTIKQLWNGTLKPVFDGICDILTGTFTGDWKRTMQGILNIWLGTFNAIKTAVTAPLDYVKNRINACVDYIKEKFNFNWELPKLKLPHFNIKGSFSLNPPKVPSFSVEWYKKAMNDPMIMNSPTAFGINANGQVMAGGEAGSEVVSGTNTLMNMISTAVSEQNGMLSEQIDKILDIISQYMPYMPEIANMQLVTDTGALVGAIAPQVDAQIGLIAKRKQRG